VRRFRNELERGGIGTSTRLARARHRCSLRAAVMQGIPARKRFGWPFWYIGR
jgi:hypothetical protein